jgi:uncharacterized protein YkwD
MRTGSTKRTAVVILLGMFAAIFAFSGTAQAGWACFHQKDAERRFAKKMNYARSQKGLRKMNLDKQMSRVARLHSKKMADHNYIYHSTITELTTKITREKLLSENVGRGGDVSGIHRAFMNSSGHRDNILRSNWRHVGVGTVTSRGVLYVTVVFESRQDPGTTVNPPSC